MAVHFRQQQLETKWKKQMKDLTVVVVVEDVQFVHFGLSWKKKQQQQQ